MAKVLNELKFKIHCFVVHRIFQKLYVCIHMYTFYVLCNEYMLQKQNKTKSTPQRILGNTNKAMIFLATGVVGTGFKDFTEEIMLELIWQTMSKASVRTGG